MKFECHTDFCDFIKHDGMIYSDTNQLALQNITEFILSIANTSAKSGSNRLLFGYCKRLMECYVRHKSINCVPNWQLKHYFKELKLCETFWTEKGKPEETPEIFFNKLPVLILHGKILTCTENVFF